MNPVSFTAYSGTCNCCILALPAQSACRAPLLAGKKRPVLKLAECLDSLLVWVASGVDWEM